MERGHAHLSNLILSHKGRANGVIEACANTCSVTTVYVQFDSFDQLESDDWQILVGQTGTHPVNHGGVSNIVTAISDITYRYAQNYQNVSGYQIVGVNDMGLTHGRRSF